MAQAVMKTIPDKAALAKLGTRVRARLAADPKVYTFPTDKAELFAVGDFLTAAECDALIAKIDETARPSVAFDTDYSSGFRTSYSGDLYRTDPFIRAIERRIDDLLGIDPEWGETVQGQRYMPGQEFKPHMDYFFTGTGYWKDEKKKGGQRSWTAMVFLNEVEAGGHTDFTQLGMSMEPKPGVLLAWNNADRNGKPNPMTIHAGCPVESGVKYIITKWYRTRNWG